MGRVRRSGRLTHFPLTFVPFLLVGQFESGYNRPGLTSLFSSGPDGDRTHDLLAARTDPDYPGPSISVRNVLSVLSVRLVPYIGWISLDLRGQTWNRAELPYKLQYTPPAAPLGGGVAFYIYLATYHTEKPVPAGIPLR